ncbi:MAG TPA: ATP-binding protein [Candidatus Polarisedimenticolaceae bacterium]|nr:ATP-binding protein [Candidatus Polarisedimenticolaceae bacterium]
MAAVTNGAHPTYHLGGRRRLRVTARLAVELFVLAVLITGACAWTALNLVDDTFRKQLTTELDLLVGGVNEVFDAETDRVHQLLARLKSYLDRDPELVEALFAEGEARVAAVPRVRETTARLMEQYQLDYLDLLDGAGMVLSSGYPERVGVPDERFSTLLDGGFQLSQIKREDQRLVITTRLDLDLGLRSLVLIGGRLIDEDLVNRLAGREAAVLYIARGAGESPRIIPSGQLLKAALGELLALGDIPAGEPVSFVVDRRTFLFKRTPLTAEAPERAWVLLGVDLTRFERLHRQLVHAFLYLGAGVGLVAALAGVWIAQRTARPVRELVSALDSIARGEADYAFGVRAPDEAQELAVSFSRMHRALENQRRRSMAAERVAAWQEVARHVAHEVKNPLAPIRLTVENLLRARSQAPERFDQLFREGMQTILEEVQQLSRMVSEFAEFARLPLPIRREVDLADLIDRVVELYASEPGVEIGKVYPAELPPLQLDSDQLSRALKNILGNAIDAARDRTDTDPAARVEIRLSIEEGMAQIEVTDNGPGLAPEVERRLFEPYFTTKPHGTGLGMALTYRIVIEHDGVIFAENRPDRGARIVIRLPFGAPGPQVARARKEAVG